MARYDQALKFTLNWEGGYSNDPLDPGGATMRGITQQTYDSYRKRKGLDPQPVALIADGEVGAIYQRYWDASSAGAFLHPLSAVMFDTAVNFGPLRAIQFYRDVRGIAPDPSGTTFTPREDIAFVAGRGPDEQRKIAEAIVERRVKYRHNRVKVKPDQVRFLRGWLNRDNALMRMVRGG